MLMLLISEVLRLFVCLVTMADAGSSRVGRVLEGGEALPIEMQFDAIDVCTGKTLRITSVRA